MRSAKTCWNAWMFHGISRMKNCAISSQEEMKESRRGRVISLMQREKLTERVFNSLRKLDVLQELLEDEEITEIMVNGPEKIFYEKRGGLYQWDKQFSSVDKLEDIIQQIAGNSNGW